VRNAASCPSAHAVIASVRSNVRMLLVCTGLLGAVAAGARNADTHNAALAAHDPKQRIENAFRAWSLFRKAFKRQLADLPQADPVAWFRTFEWIPGATARATRIFTSGCCVRIWTRSCSTALGSWLATPPRSEIEHPPVNVTEVRPAVIG